MGLIGIKNGVKRIAKEIFVLKQALIEEINLSIETAASIVFNGLFHIVETVIAVAGFYNNTRRQVYIAVS